MTTARRSRSKAPKYAAILHDQPVLVWGTGATPTAAYRDCLYWTSQGQPERHPDDVLPLTAAARRYVAAGGDPVCLVMDLAGQRLEPPVSYRECRPGVTHLVYRTAFHGGGLLSQHQSLDAAERAARRYASGDCRCPCAVVMPVGADVPDAGSTDSNGNPIPYFAAAG